MQEKNFDDWNIVKKETEENLLLHFQPRDIWYIRVGENVGFEQCGHGELFMRPVLIIKKFNESAFLGIPLSTTKKRGKYYFPFSFSVDKESVAILSQVRFFDARRLQRKIGVMNTTDFYTLKKVTQEILFS